MNKQTLVSERPSRSAVAMILDDDDEPLRDWPYPTPGLTTMPELLAPAGWVDRCPELPEWTVGAEEPGVEACAKTRREILDWIVDGLAIIDVWDDPVGSACPVGAFGADNAADASLAVVLIAISALEVTGYSIAHLRPDDPSANPGIVCSCIHYGCEQAYEEAYARGEIKGCWLTSFEVADASPSGSAVGVSSLSAQAVLDLRLRGLGW